MAEIQQWRRLVQQRRSRTDLNTQAVDPEKNDTASITSATSFQTRSEAETRPHPKNRLASYLSTHRMQSSIDKLEDPAFNWAPPKDRDRVYDPDLDAMCNTLRGRVLKFPSKDLPAQYNSFVLHLVEGYQHLLVERNALQPALDTQIAQKQEDPGRYPDTSTHWVRGRKSLEPLLSSEDPFSPKERSGNEENGTVKKLKGNVSSRSWQISPSRGMARLSQRLLNISINTDLHNSTSALGAGLPRSPLNTEHSPSSLHRTQTRNSHRTSESDRSSMIGDLLPDEQEDEQNAPRNKNTQIAFHLASWLAHRTGSDLNAVYLEIAEIISAYSDPENRPLQATCFDEGAIPSSTPFGAAIGEADSMKSKTLSKPNPNDIVNVHEVENQHKNQRPRFSFLPGDDMEVSRLTGSRSNSLSAFGSERRPGRYDAGNRSNSKDNGRATDFSALDEARGISAGPTDEGSMEPRRGDSNRSVLTAINNGSYSRPSGPLRAGSSKSGTVKKSDRVASTTKKDSFAAAAARIAGQNKSDPK
ncbi:hypothetical protein MMC11_003648 [Xylographa trunciseda]|nr:hypothetical protein [Xylographa trunciseda]